MSENHEMSTVLSNFEGWLNKVEYEALFDYTLDFNLETTIKGDLSLDLDLGTI